MSKPAFPREIKALGLTLVLTLGTAPAAGQTLEPLKDPMRLDPRRSSLAPEEVQDELDDVLPVFDEVDTAVGSTVHLASYYRAEDAMRGWDILTNRHPELLTEFDPILRDIDLGAEGLFVRLLAGPLRDNDDAFELCDKLGRQGAYCAPTDIAGDFLPLSEGDF